MFEFTPGSLYSTEMMLPFYMNWQKANKSVRSIAIEHKQPGSHQRVPVLIIARYKLCCLVMKEHRVGWVNEAALFWDNSMALEWEL